MIDFRCRCSHRFEVADDRAGESLQCPSCGLLVDVPTIEELQAMQADGSYTLTDHAPPTPRATAETGVLGYESKVHANQRIPGRHDQADRRLSLKEFLAIGTDDDDLLEIKDEIRAGIPKHPKYDPVTGELIVPMDIRKPPQAKPMMAQPVVLSYETRASERMAGIFAPFRNMFELPNMIVCVILSALYFVVTFLSGMSSVFTLLALPMLLLTISHLANVVDETGPTANDEIPRPLRGVDLYEDMIRPLGQVMLAYAVAYAPILLFNLYVSRLSWLANLGLLVLFFVLVPALLITLITSGALNNLVPHRALSVIGESSWHYWIVAAVGYAATLAAGIATIFSAGAGYTFVVMMTKAPGAVAARGAILGLPPKIEIALAPIFIFVAMYLLHVFAWQMGVLYRLHHDQFAWVLQKHDKTERNDTLAQLHRHRQSDAENKARTARANLERRLGELKH